MSNNQRGERTPSMFCIVKHDKGFYVREFWTDEKGVHCIKDLKSFKTRKEAELFLKEVRDRPKEEYCPHCGKGDFGEREVICNKCSMEQERDVVEEEEEETEDIVRLVPKGHGKTYWMRDFDTAHGEWVGGVYEATDDHLEEGSYEQCIQAIREIGHTHIRVGYLADVGDGNICAPIIFCGLKGDSNE